ncbi:MAG: glycosyltransferase [Methylobacillus glycogenes]|nr:glycosyltransferase [Methylobacillus glycogenes]
MSSQVSSRISPAPTADGPCRVAVLMATYNGIAHLQEQVESILRQSQVELTLFCSDDGSSDGTVEALQALSHLHSNIQVLPKAPAKAGAGGNFYRLLRDVDLSGFDYVSFADQDDIWDGDKLYRHAKLILSSGAGGVSSNVLAFWPNGREQLLNKAQPQCKYDYLFESAGPGCSFLMKSELAHKIKAVLNNPDSTAYQVTLHDWLCYALARAMGYLWVIDPRSSIRYRQHGNNVVGANVSFQAKFARLKKMRGGWYRQQVTLISGLAYTQSRNKDLDHLLALLEQRSLCSRLKLLPYAWQGRRSKAERFYLMIAILLNWF